MTAVIHNALKKKRLVNICVAILILKLEEKGHIFGILCFIISRKVETQLQKKKKICAVYGEATVTDQTSTLSKVVCKILRWRFLAGQCPPGCNNYLKLIAIKLRH